MPSVSNVPLMGTGGRRDNVCWCPKKKETDAIPGGVKILLSGSDCYGYPYYRMLRCLPKELHQHPNPTSSTPQDPTSVTENVETTLEGGLDPQLWADLCVEISGIQAQPNAGECVLVLCILCLVPFIIALGSGKRIVAWALGFCCFFLFVLVCLWPQQQSMQTSLDRLCDKYQDRFAEQGWKISCHKEFSPPHPRGKVHLLSVLFLQPLDTA